MTLGAGKAQFQPTRRNLQPDLSQPGNVPRSFTTSEFSLNTLQSPKSRPLSQGATQPVASFKDQLASVSLPFAMAKEATLRGRLQDEMRCLPKCPVPNTQTLRPLLTQISVWPSPNYNSADHVLWPRPEFYRLPPANPEEIQIAGNDRTGKDSAGFIQNLPGVIATADMM